MGIKENIQKIIDEFLSIENWEERYEHLIFLGRKLPKMYKNLRINNNLITGCQSKVWVCAYMKYNKIFFNAESNTILSRGIAALLLNIYSGQCPLDIVTENPRLLYSNLGFSSFLTSNRANGMTAIFLTIKKYAYYFIK